MGIFQRCSLKHFHRWLLLGVLGVAALPCAAQTLLEFKYNLVDMGSLGGTYITPSQINNLGEVVGTAWGPGGQVRAFVYSGGVLSDLGAFGQVNSRGYGINDSSTIVGGAGDGWDNLRFTYTNGTLSPLPDPFRQVLAINNAGLIAGVKLGVNGNYHAILYDGNTITDLENWASSSSPTAVNASGQVLGTIYTTSQAPTRAFIFDDGNLTLLGTLGGDRTWGYGLNDLGQVVGASQVSAGTWHAFLYQGGAMTDLGTSSWAYDINNAGTIVGGASNSPGSAFVYSQNQLELLGSVTNLGTTSFISLDEARSINDLGQITGYGTTSSGARHAFLLTPVTLTAVPEPETWTAIVGLILLAFSAKRLRARAATSARR